MSAMRNAKNSKGARRRVGFWWFEFQHARAGRETLRVSAPGYPGRSLKGGVATAGVSVEQQGDSDPLGCDRW